MGRPDGRPVTVPLPGRGTPSPAGRDREKTARKWAYLLCTTTYVPLVHADIEEPVREMVQELFDADERLRAAERVGARLVELNCVDRESLRITVDVLAGPLLAEDSPERVTRLLGAVAAGYAEALRRRTTEQQESMIRAVKAVAAKAIRVAKANEEDRDAMATELSLLRGQLSHQLLHDPLTGLPNRQFLTTRLEEVLNSGSPTTLYLLELNGFQLLNDGLGGRLADTLLFAVATRLRHALPVAMIARTDRACFAALDEQGPDDEHSLPAPASVVAMITETLSDATYVDDHGLALTANIGVVRSPPHGADPERLLHAADLALRLAKERGPGQWHLLTPTEAELRVRRPRLASIMPGAVETGQLAVGYRLRVNLADERPVAIDAYPRWALAGVGGTECVTLAEETGLSPSMGRWLLRTAGARAVETGLPLSVSLSPNQAAAPDLVGAVLDTLAEVSLPPARLRLAMPAPEVFDGRSQAVDNLKALTKAGVRTAVHDFTGAPSDVVRLPDLSLNTVSLAPRLVAQARTIGTKSLVTRAFSNLTALVHDAGATVSVDDLRSEPEVDWWRHAGADTATGPMFPIREQ
ncbi:EAL domain-containing protein [Actinophytocola oryzae]|uniref:Diguanylate cyclase (GGDEF)-like protein n=1 Tax=Actinophytocola oryzae TaxID=502181 RepID=A0A4R7VQZ3_9PSEU|nr:EAL domain-containing protein [Actinophytocola oryzae]TDV52062.1 diguanylate cyclase (GGDEF)-like protein [Actinophytocola oryzae]